MSIKSGRKLYYVYAFVKTDYRIYWKMIIDRFMNQIA